MISLPFRVACILIAGFLIVLVVTHIYKLNNRKVFWGIGLTTIIGILILLGLGILRPSWGTETGTAIIVGISTAIGCAITLIYAAEDLYEKKRMKEKRTSAIETDPDLKIADSGHNPIKGEITLTPRLDSAVARDVFAKAIKEGYIVVNGNHYQWTLNKVLLAYMCGRIYCEDYPEKTMYDEKLFWMPGRVELFPGADLDKLFNMTDITQSRHTRKNKAAPTGSEKIDKLFE